MLYRVKLVLRNSVRWAYFYFFFHYTRIYLTWWFQISLNFLHSGYPICKTLIFSIKFNNRGNYTRRRFCVYDKNNLFFLFFGSFMFIFFYHGARTSLLVGHPCNIPYVVQCYDLSKNNTKPFDENTTWSVRRPRITSSVAKKPLRKEQRRLVVVTPRR